MRALSAGLCCGHFVDGRVAQGSEQALGEQPVLPYSPTTAASRQQRVSLEPLTLTPFPACGLPASKPII